MDLLLNLPQTAGFLATAVLVTLAPGPDNLLVLSLGMARGRRAGLAFGLGCALGCLNHTLLAVLGVSALIAASPVAFTALRVAGGLYLVWLGVQALRHARPLPSSALPSPVPDAPPATGAAARPVPGDSSATAAPTGSIDPDPPARLFVKGLVANAINPKVILFFLAFLPQFVDAGRGHAAWQIAQLGTLFTAETVLIFGAIGWFAGRVGERLARHPGIGTWLDRTAGAIFILLGARLLAYA